MQKISLSEDFKPALSFRSYNLIFVVFFILLIWFCFSWIGMTDGTVFMLFVVILLAALAITSAWNSLYYDSIVYHLNETEMTWKRGVWFRQTGIVPYNRITNVDIVQGPLMRIFGISNLRIQTAGYSAQNVAEIRISGIEEPEPLREMIMGFVRSRGPVAAATGGDDSENPGQVSTGEILDELREIRKILNKIAEK
jgi:membrane protein YdbS with pleckstrin-like domain